MIDIQRRDFKQKLLIIFVNFQFELFLYFIILLPYPIIKLWFFDSWKKKMTFNMSGNLKQFENVIGILMDNSC